MSKPFEVQEAERVIADVQAQLADTVTITISREDAERWASDDDHIHAAAWEPVDEAIRAALEGER